MIYPRKGITLASPLRYELWNGLFSWLSTEIELFTLPKVRNLHEQPQP
jgi:hypothetical protein